MRRRDQERLHSRRRARRLSTVALRHTIVAAGAAIALAPFYVMLTSSLKSVYEFRLGSFGLPKDPTFENYGRIWTDLGFDQMFGNSAILSISASAAATALGATAAYAFARLRFRFQRGLLGAMVALLAVPATVIIVPVFLVMSDLGWVNTYRAAILVETGLLLPFSVFLLYSYMRDLPDELFDAAAVDGAGRVRQFWEIALPLSRPALVTSALVGTILVWSDLLVPLILWQTDELQTVMVGLAMLGPGRSGVQDVPLLMAGVTISIAPLVVLFVLGRRALSRGLFGIRL